VDLLVVEEDVGAERPKNLRLRQAAQEEFLVMFTSRAISVIRTSMWAGKLRAVISAVRMGGCLKSPVVLKTSR
jgi:hypothetical protein